MWLAVIECAQSAHMRIALVAYSLRTLPRHVGASVFECVMSTIPLKNVVRLLVTQLDALQAFYRPMTNSDCAQSTDSGCGTLRTESNCSSTLRDRHQIVAAMLEAPMCVHSSHAHSTNTPLCSCLRRAPLAHSANAYSTTLPCHEQPLNLCTKKRPKTRVQ